MIWQVRDPIYKKERDRKTKSLEDVLVDEGVSDKRLLVVESEFAQCLRVVGREGNTLSAVIRNAWDRGDLESLTKNSPAKATTAPVRIAGIVPNPVEIKEAAPMACIRSQTASTPQGGSRHEEPEERQERVSVQKKSIKEAEGQGRVGRLRKRCAVCTAPATSG